MERCVGKGPGGGDDDRCAHSANNTVVVMPSRPSRPSGTRLLQRLACVVLLVIGIVALQPTGTLAQAVPGQPAVNTVQQQTLRAGWYRWDPYQYLESSEDRTELTGLDVQLLREVFENKLGLRYQLGEVS